MRSKLLQLFKNGREARSLNLRFFMASRFMAALGDQILMFAVPLLILKTTGSVAYSGLAFAIEWTPRLLLLPLTGSIADRFEVRKLYRIADGLRTSIIGILSILLFMKVAIPLFWVLSITMALLSILNSVVFIAMEATLPRQLPADQMPRAQALLQTCDQMSQILGPAIAGLSTAFFDLSVILSFAGLFFAFSFLNALTMPRLKLDPAKVSDPSSSPWKGVSQTYLSAFRIVAGRPILIQLMSITWIINIIYGSVLVLSPAIMVQYFGLSPKYFGYLQTSAAISSILVFSLVPKMNSKIGLVGIGLLASVIFFSGAAVASLGISALLFGLGVILVYSSDGLFNVYIRSLRATVIPKEHLGKVTGLIIMLNNTSIPMSGFIVSQLAKYLNSKQMLGVLTLTSMSLFAMALIIGKWKLRYPGIMPNLEKKSSRNEEIIKPTSVCLEN